jgi:hypothetical protein
MNRKIWIGILVIIILIAGGVYISKFRMSEASDEGKELNNNSVHQELNSTTTPAAEELPKQTIPTSTEFKPDIIPKPSLKDQGISITKNGDTSLLTDKQTNISFSYPTAWGPIEIEEEQGGCTPTINDPCNLRMYIFSGSKVSGLFLVTETAGHHEDPPGRDGFWGDGAGSITESFASGCTPKNNCELITNEEGTIIEKGKGLWEFGDDEVSAAKKTVYDTFSEKGPYHGFILTASRFSAPGSAEEKQFEEVVIGSLKLSAE